METCTKMILPAKPRENKQPKLQQCYEVPGLRVLHQLPTNTRHHPLCRPHGPSSRRCWSPSDRPEIVLLTKETLKSTPGTLFLPSGTVQSNSPHGDELLCYPLSIVECGSGGNINIDNYNVDISMPLAADPKAGSAANGLIWQLPIAPAPLHMPGASTAFQPAAKGACFPNSRHNAATHRAASERQCQTKCPEYKNK